MSEIKWIKITTDIFDDEKIKIIEKMPEGDTMLVIWLKLLVLAGKKNDSGLVYLTDSIPYTPDILSDIFNRDSRIISLAINTFVSFGMIEVENDIIQVLNWNRHQNIEGMDKIRKQNRERQIKYRQNKALSDSNVTSRDSNGTDKNKNKNKNKNTNTGAEEAFEKFYSIYPKKRAKPQAKRAFIKQFKNIPSLPELSEIIDKLKLTESWKKNNGQYIPYPATWLNAEGWNDDIPEPWTDPEEKARERARATNDVIWYVCPDCGYAVRNITPRDTCPGGCGEPGVAFRQCRGKEYPKEMR